MKKSIKSYLVFTSVFYRIVMYLLIPAALLGIAFWVGTAGNVALTLLAGILPMAEIISDSWVFGGIQTKESVKMDYLKTSARGKNILRNALIMDMVRRFLSVAGILGIGRLIIWLGSRTGEEKPGAMFLFEDSGDGGSLGIFLYLLVLCYFISALGTFLSRYGSLIWINAMVAYVVSALEGLCLFLPGLWQHAFAYALLFAVLGILVSVLAVRTAMKKMEGSYYDR